MRFNNRVKNCVLGMALLTGLLVVGVSPAIAQVADQSEVEKTTVANNKEKNSPAPQPVFDNFRSIKIGMTADEVRRTLDHLKDKGTAQDFFVFSDSESAQVFYDKDRRVTAISVDYLGSESNSPTPRAVLGEDLEAKPDGSMYQLKRYPSAGFWVSYNRTAGNNLIVTITMQKAQ